MFRCDKLVTIFENIYRKCIDYEQILYSIEVYVVDIQSDLLNIRFTNFFNGICSAVVFCDIEGTNQNAYYYNTFSQVGDLIFYFL